MSPTDDGAPTPDGASAHDDARPGSGAGADDARGSSGAPTPPPAAARPRRPDESMSLLREVLDNPLDAGYRQWAEQTRGAQPSAPLRGWQRVAVVAACAVIGAGAVWSARELRPQVQTDSARSLLVEEIGQRRAEGDALSAENARALAEVDRLQRDALAGVDEAVLDRAEELGVVSGQTPVHGKGVVVELTDSAAAQQGEPGTDDQRVKDVDLQVVVNALWASGAEAIAINGQRLGMTSAIRTAGQAVLVNLEPIVSPYRIEVIGDPNGLQTNLSRTAAATHLSVLRETYDISVEIRRADDLELAGRQARSLHAAVPVEGRAKVAPASPGVPGSDGERGTGPAPQEEVS
ncbi:DUF881 domain-containing protein [Georgenia ruanii]|uniref:DUF881 domain-containing protein n=1 Tax=Georgenia ruanii TaxID=348442 RepID=A0A7J9UVH5_9MICO|nr:DUF881 domain-containing protein [Georgenia ruanii]MPV88606.1 DUF881 domain-containing protein [Georgenia ruanii]